MVGGRSSSSSKDKDGDREESFEEGDKIEARFGGRDKWFKGKISYKNRDGSYEIRYDDGDSERNVEASFTPLYLPP